MDYADYEAIRGQQLEEIDDRMKDACEPNSRISAETSGENWEREV